MELSRQEVRRDLLTWTPNMREGLLLPRRVICWDFRQRNKQSRWNHRSLRIGPLSRCGHATYRVDDSIGLHCKNISAELSTLWEQPTAGYFSIAMGLAPRKTRVTNASKAGSVLGLAGNLGLRTPRRRRNRFKRPWEYLQCLFAQFTQSWTARKLMWS